MYLYQPINLFFQITNFYFWLGVQGHLFHRLIMMGLLVCLISAKSFKKNLFYPLPTW